MAYKEIDEEEEEEDPNIESNNLMDTKSKNQTNLEGKQLQVYWYLITNGPKGIREIQKELKFSSPSTASYQIKKLIEIGIVSKQEESDKYYVKEEIKTGLMGFYIRFGLKMIPRFTIYLALHLVSLVGCIILFLLLGEEYLLHPASLLLIF